MSKSGWCSIGSRGCSYPCYPSFSPLLYYSLYLLYVYLLSISTVCIEVREYLEGDAENEDSESSGLNLLSLSGCDQLKTSFSSLPLRYFDGYPLSVSIISYECM